MGGFSSKQAVPAEYAEYSYADSNPNLLETIQSQAGKKCTFKDKGEFQFRMYQLKLLDWMIDKIGSALQQNISTINFERLIKDILVYHDIKGDITIDYLVKDPLFQAPWENVNKFTEIQNYLTVRSGRSQEQTKTDFEEYYQLILKFRQFLIEQIILECV